MIDLVFTSSNQSVQNSQAVETGLSNFHKMTITVLKTYFKQKKPITVTHRNHENCFNDIPRQLIFDEFAKMQVCNKMLPLQNHFNVCIKKELMFFEKVPTC